MLSGLNVIDNLSEEILRIAREEISVEGDKQEAIAALLRDLIRRDRRFINGQIQLAFALFHCCTTFEALRAEIDEILLSEMEALSSDITGYDFNLPDRSPNDRYKQALQSWNRDNVNV